MVDLNCTINICHVFTHNAHTQFPDDLNTFLYSPYVHLNFPKHSNLIHRMIDHTIFRYNFIIIEIRHSDNL